ncbi:uncharacterized protein LOC6560789 [Drosophila grimshawi]|uniref:GH22072 n=1 Tax=Drosophila grimshawi TaxID=7222 RepID=B4J9Y7_DROGR|nr:uncharacterized protein LOC6560789 [Drosophila grimshawi]EDW02574.1 GH22072 [Drosophila grimshawi]EDW02575.1 GH22073 [Drosophila grimshawi]
MEHEFVPKSPTSTLCEDESDDGNNAKFLGPIHLPTPFTGGHPFNGNANVSTSPLLLATPPLSPLDMSVQNPNMPMASAMLPSNYSSLYPPTGYIRIIPCFVCSQLFTDIVPLSKHLQMHATQIMHMNSTNAVCRHDDHRDSKVNTFLTMIQALGAGSLRSQIIFESAVNRPLMPLFTHGACTRASLRCLLVNILAKTAEAT